MAFGLVDLFRPGIEAARAEAQRWRAALAEVFSRVPLLALPTMPIFPPRIEDLAGDNSAVILDMTRHTSPFNLACTPCTAQPIPVAGSALPASLQLVGPPGGEELLASAAVVERAMAR